MRRDHRGHIGPALAVGLACSVLVLAACAKRGMPPGGPEDATAPFVAEQEPASGSVGVDLQSAIAITFSENMKRRSVETGVVVSPPCKWEKRYWTKTTYVLVPEGGLKPNTTYLISVSNVAADAHGVKMASTYVAGFSTGEEIDAGVISGRVRWKGMDVQQAVVELFDAASFGEEGAVADQSSLDAGTPVYITLTGRGGLYRIPFVDTKRSYRLGAFVDSNLNGAYDEEENRGCSKDTVSFTDTLEVEDVDITLCGERLSGNLVGTVDTTGVGGAVQIVAVARAASDTALSYRAAVGTAGTFVIDCAVPGEYSIEVFSDYDRDFRRDEEDSFSVEIPGTVTVRPCAGARVGEVRLTDED